MQFNKDSKLIKTSASAPGHLSGVTAYGEIFIPNEVYVNNKDVLERMSTCIEFEEYTVSDILKMKNEPYEGKRNIDKLISDAICDNLGLYYSKSETLVNFTKMILGLEKFYEYKDAEVVLEKNTEIQGIIIPKGTMIEFSQKNESVIPDDWAFEYKLE